jgi:S-sulfo-L-cysteine synthase (O-acetyl-L-serine-dependent)
MVESILDLIGNTPLVAIKRVLPKSGAAVFGKMEGHNPGGSVKDRAALSMIKGAFDRGELKPGTRLLEATSGNTGIALAMIASHYGIPITLIMPDNSTQERIDTMRAFGAELILTPADKTIEYSREMADEMLQRGGYYMLNQFANPDNPAAHYRTTGPEIWRDTGGKITHFISSMGTTGTIMGVSKYLKEQNPDIQIIGVQPEEGVNIPGIRRWSPAFLPKIYEPARVDRIIDITREEATTMARRLAREESVFAGMSSGGAVAAAAKLLGEINQGLVVCILCDRGDRYLSSDLFK